MWKHFVFWAAEHSLAAVHCFLYGRMDPTFFPNNIYSILTPLPFFIFNTLISLQNHYYLINNCNCYINKIKILLYLSLNFSQEYINKKLYFIFLSLK